MFERKGNQTGVNRKDMPKFPLPHEDDQIRNIRYVSNTCLSFTLALGGLCLYNLKLVEGKDGDFIGVPSEKGSDGKYYPKYSLYLTKEDTEWLIEAVRNKYLSQEENR